VFLPHFSLTFVFEPPSKVFGYSAHPLEPGGASIVSANLAGITLVLSDCNSKCIGRPLPWQPVVISSTVGNHRYSVLGAWYPGCVSYDLFTLEVYPMTMSVYSCPVMRFMQLITMTVLILVCLKPDAGIIWKPH